MGLADYVAVVTAKWRSIVLVFLGGVAAAAALVAATPVTYQAVTNVLLSVVRGDTAGELMSGTTFTESQTNSFAVIAVSPLVLEPAMHKLGTQEPVEAFRGRISAKVVQNTTIISITATAATAQRAAQIADAVANQLVTTVDDMAPMGDDGKKMLQARLIASALAPSAPSEPAWKRMLLLGGIIGLAAGYVQALIRTVVGRRVRVSKDIELVTSAPVIGSIRFDPDTGGVPATWTDPDSRRSQDYRTMLANLQFLGFGRGQLAVVFTSAMPGEGKTTTVLNLGVLLARSGAETLLVDGDLRNPSLARWFDWDKSVGLTTAIAGRTHVEDAIQHTSIPHLDVLPAGPIPPDPAQLLASPAIGKLFHDLNERYDYVVVDSPALSGHPDATLLVKLVGETILVVQAGRTTLSQAGRAVGAVEAVFGEIRGVVLSQVRRDPSSPIAVAQPQLATAETSKDGEPEKGSGGD